MKMVDKSKSHILRRRNTNIIRNTASLVPYRTRKRVVEVVPFCPNTLCTLRHPRNDDGIAGEQKWKVSICFVIAQPSKSHVI